MKDVLLTSSVLILALVLLRFLFRRTVSRRVQYALWLLVLLRLLIPVSLPAMKYSVLTAAEPVRDTAVWEAASQVSALHVPRMSYTRAYGEVLAEHEAAGAEVPLSDSELDSRAYARMASPLTLRDALHLIWYVGMGFTALLLLLVNLRFARKLRRTRVPLEGTGSKYPVYLCDDIPSPCLFGLCKPAIYVTSPAARDPDTLRYVLAHEETHVRHLDPLWSLLRSLCLAVWWFDPLVWLAAQLSRLDGELACDEGALARLGENERIPYGETLLRLIPLGRGGSPMLTATTMTAGKRQMKDRIRRIAEHRRPLVIALAAVLLLAGLACACTFTGARREPGPEVTGVTVFDGPEAYLEHLLRQTTGLTYTTEAGETREPDARVGELRKEAELAGLHSQGTLELYAYRIEYRLEGADPEDVLTLPGVTYVTEEGWCDLNGPHSMILLRREDGTVSVLFDRIDGDDRGGLYYYEESPEEMLYDWYARERDPNLPPYTIDLLPADREGNHPARRYDGEGWYIYIPIPAWEEQRGEGFIRWVSRYGTGSSITVRESSVEETTADPLRQPEPGQMWLYALGEDGRYWYVETRYDPERITDAPEVRDEPRLLEAMLESFRGRTAERVTGEAPPASALAYLLPQYGGGSHPAQRYDGEGWYIFIPIQGWEEREGENKWVSRYHTGSGISVRETTREYMEEEREKTAPGQEERYVEGADGRLWLIVYQFDPESITDTPEIRDEPRLLEAMMESFTAPGGRDVLRRTWLHTVPSTLEERMGEAADRIFGAYDAPGTGYFLAVEAEGERREYAVDREYVRRGDTLSTGAWLQKAYFWTPLTEEEVAALDRDPGHGPVLTAWNETDRFTVYALSDVLCWTELRDGAEHWLRPSGNAESLYAFFLSDARIAEMYRPEAEITVPGTVTDYDAAALQMAEQYGAILLDFPAWYATPPYDLALLSTEVFDAYYGEDYPNFCFNMIFALKLDEQNRDYFEAGAGLGDPIPEGPYAGWYRWGGEVIAALEDDLWRFNGLNTGGTAVWLPCGVGWAGRYEQLTTEQLVSLWFLTRGRTHDWNLLYNLSLKPVDEVLGEMEKLPEERRQALLEGMEGYNAAYGEWYGTFDTEAFG